MIGKAVLDNLGDREERLALAKVIDRANRAIKCKQSQFSDFLNPFMAHKFMEILKSERDLNIILYGGYVDAERLKIGFFPDFDEPLEESFDISAVEIKYNSQFSSSLTHRDFLGSLMGLGITREKIGDILLEKGRAIAFVDNEIADYVVLNLEKVKHTKVNCGIICDYKPKASEVSEKKFTVASLRLDSVLSHSFNLSRGRASDLIKGEKAFVNWKNETSCSKIVGEGDIITLRGLGRIKVLEILGTTKKDRILINIGIYK